MRGGDGINTQKQKMSHAQAYEQCNPAQKMEKYRKKIPRKLTKL